MYPSQGGREEPEIELSLTDTNNYSFDLAVRPLGFPFLFSLSFLDTYSQMISGSMQILSLKNVKVMVRQ